MLYGNDTLRMWVSILMTNMPCKQAVVQTFSFTPDPIKTLPRTPNLLEPRSAIGLALRCSSIRTVTHLNHVRPPQGRIHSQTANPEWLL